MTSDSGAPEVSGNEDFYGAGLWTIDEKVCGISRPLDLPKTNSSGSIIGGSCVRCVPPSYRNSDVMNPHGLTLVLRRISNASSQSNGRKLRVTQLCESTQRGRRFSEVLFAVETAGAVDAARFAGVLDSADTLVIVRARLTHRAAETILRDDFMACSRRGPVNAVRRTASQLTPAVEGSDKAIVCAIYATLSIRAHDMRYCGSRYCGKGFCAAMTHETALPLGAQERFCCSD